MPLRACIAMAACALLLAPMPAVAQCPDGTPAPCGGRRAAPPPNSVAVLEFENLSRDTADAYLSQGLTEELTSRLGQLGRLTVASHTAVSRLRGAAAMPVTAIGRALNVAYLVDGSVRRSGQRLRVTVELLRAATGDQRWSSQYDRSDQDLLDIQQAVATEVATAVAGSLLPDERATLAARPTRSAAAYDAFLRGNALSRTQVAYHLPEAVALYERAIGLDSTFAAAWSALSQAHSAIFWFYIDRSPERLARARQAADRAAALAPDAAETHVAMGYFHYWGSRDYALALQDFSAALASRPNDPEVHSALANVARRQGAWEQSLASRSRAIELDPGDVQDVGERGLTYQTLRRYDEAEADYRRSLTGPHPYQLAHLFSVGLALERYGDPGRAGGGLDTLAAHAEEFAEQTFHDPGIALPVWRAAGPHQGAVLGVRPGPSDAGRTIHYLIVGQVLASLGRSGAATAFDSARTAVEALLARRPDDDGFHAQLALALAGLGRCDSAVSEARRAVALMPVSADALTGPQRAQTLAEILAACGKPDEALDQIAYLLSIPSFVTPALLRSDPAYASLRGMPRFEQLLAGR